MRVYFDPTTRRVLYTVTAAIPGIEPEGDFIETDDPLPGPIDGLEVDAQGVIHVANIQPHRDLAVAEVNAVIDRVRRKFITGIVGQEMIYQAKEKEALDFVAQDPLPTDLTPYPFIAAEVGVTASTAYEVAQVYLNLAALWRGVGASLEQARLSTIGTVSAATDGTSIDQALAALRTAMEAY